MKMYVSMSFHAKIISGSPPVFRLVIFCWFTIPDSPTGPATVCRTHTLGTIV